VVQIERLALSHRLAAEHADASDCSWQQRRSSSLMLPTVAALARHEQSTTRRAAARADLRVARQTDAALRAGDEDRHTVADATCLSGERTLAQATVCSGVQFEDLAQRRA
jgi:hypothetical protein